jgi:hypothetical protein
MEGRKRITKKEKNIYKINIIKARFVCSKVYFKSEKKLPKILSLKFELK